MKKILIVDDSISNISALKLLLKSQYNILTATNGKEALQILNKHQVDLILLDIILPDIDGYEVCKIIKSQSHTKNIPVIFVTAILDVESISKAYKVGGVDYITKPLKAIEVLCRIETQLKLMDLISELQKAKKELEQLASKDFLTGIYNRRSFEIFANNMIESKDNLSLILIDIDYFKQINDTYGHLVGDEILKYVANKIKSLIRNDDIFARIGGEEFAILLKDISLDNIKLLAEKLRKNIEKEIIKIDGYEISISISIGISTLNKGDNLKSLLHKADIALYKAKKSGRNRIEVYSM